MENYAEEIGLSDRSTFHGVPVKQKNSIPVRAADEKQVSERK